MFWPDAESIQPVISHRFKCLIPEKRQFLPLENAAYSQLSDIGETRINVSSASDSESIR